MATATTTLPENAQPLCNFCGRLPGLRPGTKTHVATLIRYATHGVRGLDSRRVVLRAVRFGTRWLTTEEWWNEFVRALTTAPAANAEIQLPRSPSERQGASSAAERELIARGA